MCLPIEKANDGIIDCLGAADEPTLCANYLDENDGLPFCCNKDHCTFCIEARNICNNLTICRNNEDEQACRNGELTGISREDGICTRNYESDGSDVIKVLCRYFTQSNQRWRIYFTLDQSQSLKQKYQKQEITLAYSTIQQSVQWYQPRCHRGFDLQVWLDKEKKITRNVCLCPSSYYGDTCVFKISCFI
jgi:hypothetical protein